MGRVIYMNVDSVFSNICGRLRKAVKLHESLIDYFNFLGYRGFSALQTYQMFAEKRELSDVKEYYILSYNVLLNDKEKEDNNYLPDEWANKTRFDIESGEKVNRVKEALEMWGSWESESLKFYENRCCDLMELHEIDAFNYVVKIVNDVSDEIKRCDKLLVRIKGTNWDSARIDEMQDSIERRYRKKLMKGKWLNGMDRS